MRHLIWVVFFISFCASADQSHNQLNREQCESVIQKQFPNFHIMREDDFPKMYKGRFHDGVNGSLIFGKFYSDKQLDFAAFLIGTKKDEYSYESAIVICRGYENNKYACSTLSKGSHYSEEDDMISLVPHGTYSCIENEHNSSSLYLKFDAVGWASEKASEIYVPQADGSFEQCITSD